MKKNLFLIGFLLVNTLVFKAKAQEDRFIYFVHGIGGNQYCWNRAIVSTQSGVYSPNGKDFSFASRKVQSKGLVYDQTNSFPEAAQSLYEAMMQINITPINHDRTKDFVIAHSQGGLVVRTLDRKMHDPMSGLSRTFGGIVTFGTPHGGAAVINDLGLQLNNFISSICTGLVAGPAQEVVEGSKGLSFVINVFGLQDAFEKFQATSCGKIGGIIQFAVNMTIPALGQYYKTNSPYLWSYGSGPCYGNNIGLQGTGTNWTGLNLYTTDVPKVAFYGIEDKAGICARTLYSLTLADANQQPSFMAQNTDALALTEFNNLLNNYIAKKTDFNNQAINNNNKIWTPGRNSKTESLIRVRDAYQKGIDLIGNADALYQNVIGANSIGYNSVSSQVCDCPIVIDNPTTGHSDGWSNAIKQKNQSPLDLKTKYNVPEEGFSIIKTEENIVNKVISVSTGKPEKLQQNPCGVNCTVRNVVTTYAYTIIQDSDGIVLTSSALKFPGCTYNILMQGSNHNQMKNDANTKTALNSLFSGSYGAYFATPTR